MLLRSAFIAAAVLLINFGAFCQTPDERKNIVGMTFSQVQCDYLDMDWRELFEKTLEMKFDIIRIGAYWSRIEKSIDEYDFSELDCQVDAAKRSNQKLLITVGMKAPRWPEYFIPGWLLERKRLRPGRNVAQDKFLRERTLKFIEKVIRRYQDSEVIYAWQVENEPLNRSGPNNWWIGHDLLQEEIALVKNLDTKSRPIVVNVATYPNKFLRILTRLAYVKNPIYDVIDIAEIPALNIYPALGHRVLNLNFCIFTHSKVYKEYLRPIIKLAQSKNKELIVTELQAEPWEPGKLVHIREAKAITCWPESFAQSFSDIRSLGIDTIFLWGVEYWYHRKETYNDGSWLEAAGNILER